MSDSKKVKIIAFVGMPGAGKSSAVDYVSEKQFPKVYFGGILYAAMNEAGIDITPKSQEVFRREIREREGKDFVVKRAVKQIEDLIEAGQHRIIADGIYSWSEYKIMKRAFPGQVHLIAVIAPRNLRYHRLKSRPERPFTREESEQRDWSEIEDIEKGGPIAIADHYVINDGNLEQLHEQIDRELRSLAFID